MAQANEPVPAPTAEPASATATLDVVSHRAIDLLPTPMADPSPTLPTNVYPERDLLPESQAAPPLPTPIRYDLASEMSTGAADLGDLQLRQAAPSQAMPPVPIVTPPTSAQTPVATPPVSPSVPDPSRTQPIIDPTITTPKPDGTPGNVPPIEEVKPEQTLPSEDDVDDGDGGLDKIPVRPIPLPPKSPPKLPKAKWLFLSGRLDYFNSGNVFAATDSLQDGLIRTGVTLSAFPKLGRGTYFLGAVDSNLVRYGKYGKSPDALNYDELRFRAGILQQLTPRMYGEIGWTNQKLFTAKDGLRNILSGDRFLNENSLRVELSRTDPLGPKLSLSNYYQFRWSTSNRADNDRLSHSLFTALNYKFTPNWNAGLDYFISWSHYTNVDRDDVYQQVQLRTGYNVTRNLQMNLFGGYSFGGSTDDRAVFGRSPRPGVPPNAKLQYDAWFFGVNLVLNLPLL